MVSKIKLIDEPSGNRGPSIWLVSDKGFYFSPHAGDISGSSHPTTQRALSEENPLSLGVRAPDAGRARRAARHRFF